MADAALTVVINKAVEISANLLLERSTRLHQLPENIEWIERQMRHFNSCLKDAETKEFQSHEVANLINEMRDLALDIEDLLDTYLPKIESHKQKGLCHFVKRAARIPCYRATANTFSLKIEKIKERAREIERKREKCGIIAVTTNPAGNAQDDPWDERRRFLVRKEPIIVGREETLENLRQEVLSEASKCKKICVVGEGGVGKTTVVKKLYRDVEKEFECTAMVCVSMQPKIKELLLEIAQQVGLEKEKREENLEVSLQSLLEHKKYIIFLDDIWDPKSWDHFLNIIPTNSENGSRIIITSRYTEVGRYIGGESSLKRLEGLNGEKSWELFVSLLENDGELKHLEPIGREIVKKCAGLPLAISVVVGMLRMRKRSEDAWREVLTSMSSSGENDCLKILSLSYKDLPMDLRPLFLYFGLFPDDREIHIDELAVAWDTEKLIKIEKTQRSERGVAAKLEKLYDRNLIQVFGRDEDDRILICGIHDVLRSLCIVIAEKNSFFSTFQNIGPINLALNLRRLTLGSSSIITQYFSSNFRASKLRSLLCFSDNAYTTLPEQIGNLSSLNYLKLVGPFHSIPLSIWNLKKLQTFDASDAYFLGQNLIPTSAILLMIRSLKHLLIERDSSYWMPIPIMIREIIKYLSYDLFLPNLESLYEVNGDHMDAIVLRKLSNLRNLGLYNVHGEHLEVISSSKTPPIFDKLQQLSLMGIHQFDRLNLSGYHHLLKLTLKGDLDAKPLIHHVQFPPNLIELSILEFITVDDDVMKGVKGLPKLEFLKLGRCKFTNSKLDWSGENSFPQLQVLIVNWCSLNGVGSFDELIVDDQAMPNLRKFIYEPDADFVFRAPERIRKLIINYLELMHNNHCKTRPASAGRSWKPPTRSQNRLIHP